jgi:hypothetical protein
MGNDSIIELQFFSADGISRWPCDFCCGGSTGEKVAILCEADNGEDGAIIRACEQCLKAGQDRLDDRLRENADYYERRAKELRGMIGGFKIPTYEAWEAAERLAHLLEHHGEQPAN